MTENPRDLRYTKEHEWVRLQEDGIALVGITAFAQEELGDIVFLNLPQPGSQVERSAKMGEVESVKAVSDLFSPVTGEVLEVNQEVIDHPERVNEEPYGGGWLLKVRIASAGEVQGLLAAEEYEEHLAAQS